MGEFFKSWRRKTSPTKIAISCMFAVGYVGMFVLTRSFGQAGMAVTLVSAAAVAGIICMAERKDLGGIVNVVVSTICGAAFGLIFLSDVILRLMHGYSHNAWENVESQIVGVIAGAIIGATLPTLAAQSGSKSA